MRASNPSLLQASCDECGRLTSLKYCSSPKSDIADCMFLPRTFHLSRFPIADSCEFRTRRGGPLRNPNGRADRYPDPFAHSCISTPCQTEDDGRTLLKPRITDQDGRQIQRNRLATPTTSNLLGFKKFRNWRCQFPDCRLLNDPFLGVSHNFGEILNRFLAIDPRTNPIMATGAPPLRCSRFRINVLSLIPAFRIKRTQPFVRYYVAHAVSSWTRRATEMLPPLAYVVGSCSIDRASRQRVR